MLIEIPYDRTRAVLYARTWALSRNPLFTDFTGRGGNCTNFVSQCLLAGMPVMNFTRDFGWYYRSENDRAPAWSGVEELYRFLTRTPPFRTENGDLGPYATEVREESGVEIGDVIQLADAEGDFYHTLIITDLSDSEVFVSAHTNDALDRPLSSYDYAGIRVLHIEGALLSLEDTAAFQRLLAGEAIETFRICRAE